MDLLVTSNLLRIMIFAGVKLRADFIVNVKFQSKKLVGGHQEKVFSPSPLAYPVLGEGECVLTDDVDDRDWVFGGKCVGWDKRRRSIPSLCTSNPNKSRTRYPTPPLPP